MIKQRWQEYCDRYPYKWQWWISGFVWGFFSGRIFFAVRHIHLLWQPLLVENFTRKDAALLAFDIRYDVLESEEDFQNWFTNRGYTLKPEQEDTTRT